MTATKKASTKAGTLHAHAEDVNIQRILEAVEALALSQHRIEGKLGDIAAQMLNGSKERNRRQTLVVESLGPTPAEAARVSSSKRIRATALSSSCAAQRDLYSRLRSRTSVISPEMLDLSKDIDLSQVQEDAMVANHSLSSGVGLPPLWPSSVAMREFCQESRLADTSSLNLEKMLAHKLKILDGSTSANMLSSSFAVGWYGLLLGPRHPVLLVRDFLGFFVLLHDLLVTPFTLGWGMESSGRLLQIMWVSGLYWTLNVVLEFITGFYNHGELIMKQPDVFCHYARTKFPMDFILSVCDWIFLIFGEQVGNLILVIRLCRLFKVMHMIYQLVRVFDKFSTHVMRPWLKMLMSALKLVFPMLLATHIICCIWFLIGRVGPTESGLRWLKVYEAHQAELVADPHFGLTAESSEDYKPLHQYLLAFHWTVAQITQGASEVVPVNACELLLNVLLMFCSLLFSTTIVAWVSAQMVQFIVQRQDKKKMLAEVRRFLRQSSVPQALQIRVEAQIVERLAEEKMLVEEDVEGLKLLSKKLRAELLHETRMPYILTHPLFKIWGELDSNASKCLCEEAVDFVFLLSRDVLFLPGRQGEEAFYVVGGDLLYTQTPESSKVPKETWTEVAKGAWLCEVALWAHWCHVGALEATTACQVLAIQAPGLLRVLENENHLVVSSVTRAYGRNFHGRLTSAVPPHAEWPTDLHVPFTESFDLMSQDVGLGLLRRADREGLINHAQYLLLENEVREGLCALQQSMPDGKLERIVSLVTVRIEQDGQSFIQIARWDDKKGMRVKVQLPGSKRASGELPQAAMDRVLRTDLGPLVPYIEVETTEQEVEYKQSPNYNMPTKYLRTDCIASLKVPRCELNLPKASTRQCEIPELCSILPRDVFTLPDGCGYAYYSWLAPEEVALLKEPQGARLVELWLSHVDLKGKGEDHLYFSF